MSLNLSRLEKPRMSGGKTIARCPACAETGNDTGADHLFINSDGKFGCVLYQSTDGADHRKRIFELVGIADAKPAQAGDKPVWTAQSSAPSSAPFPSLSHYKHGTPSAHWIYRTPSGAMAGIVARFDLAAGKKETIPLAWCRDQNGNTGWRWKSMPDPRPLYGLPLDEDFVVIVEGEKCAEAVRAAGLPITTWAGGSGAIHKTDWSPLAGKVAVIWPDNDEPGRKALDQLVRILTPITEGIQVVSIPAGMPVGWDAADTTPQEIRRLIDEAAPPKPDQKKSVSDIYGPPVFTAVKKGQEVIEDINEGFWAGLYADENIVLHEPGEKTFYKYDDGTGLFSPETPDRIKHDISARLLGESSEAGMVDLMKFRKDSKLNSVVATLRGIAEERDAFENRPQTVHLANCFLRLDPHGYEKLPFSPSFKSRNQSPIAYDPAATCPRFLSELIIPAVHQEDVVLLQKMIGQALLGRNLVQRFVILDGPGGRGKTQLVNVLQLIVGRMNSTQLRTHLLNERFEIYRFLKRTLLTGIDVPADFLSTKPAQVIKGLVGGDWFDAEQKGGTGSFQIKGNFNIFITSNSRLKIKIDGDVSAWRRRLLIVRYEAPPPKKKIPDFAEMLVDQEGSGILNWALDGIRMLMDDIANHGDITLTDRQKGVVESLLAESESLRHFLETRIENVPGRNLTVDGIVEGYADYCPEMGWTALGITEIQRDLPSLMLEKFRTVRAQDIQRDGKSKRGFRNVAFVGESEI